MRKYMTVSMACLACLCCENVISKIDLQIGLAEDQIEMNDWGDQTYVLEESVRGYIEGLLFAKKCIQENTNFNY